MNGQYLSALPAAELLPPVRRRAGAHGRGRRPAGISARSIDAVKARSRTILHVAEQVAVRLDPSARDARSQGRGADPEDGPGLRGEPPPRRRRARSGGRGGVERRSDLLDALKRIAESHGLKLGDAMQPDPGGTRPAPRSPSRSTSCSRWWAASTASGGSARSRRNGSESDPRRDARGSVVAGRGARRLRRKPAARPAPARARYGAAADPRRRPSAACTPPTAAAASSRAVRLAFVGDINLGTATLPDGVPPDSGRGLLDRARAALVGDLVVGNFEGVLADTGTSEKCRRMSRRGEPRRHVRPADGRWRTPSTAATRLLRLSHTHGAGAPPGGGRLHPPQPGQQPRQRLRPRGPRIDRAAARQPGAPPLRPAGAASRSTPSAEATASRPSGSSGFTTYPYAYDLLDIARSAAVVDSVRPLVDLLVVTFHGGSEGVRALHVARRPSHSGGSPAATCGGGPGR